MSVRFTTLPCGLKIRLHESNLELRGDWGVPEAYPAYGRRKASSATRRRAALQRAGNTRRSTSVTTAVPCGGGGAHTPPCRLRSTRYAAAVPLAVPHYRLRQWYAACSV